MVGPSWLSSRSWRLYRLAICILGFFIVLTGCKKDRTPQLLGAWQASLLIEEGDTIDVILDDVGLFFDADGSYIYTSTLDYEESGTFRSSGDMLFTTPILQDTLVERPVAIALLTEDALHLNMQEGEKSRILEFERVYLDDPSPEDEMDVHAHDHDGHDHDGHDHGEEYLDEQEVEGVLDTSGINEIND